ncbi:MAG: hypothetical protein WAM14_08485 [Candidatus Nitrosopolaris sp.]
MKETSATGAHRYLEVLERNYTVLTQELYFEGDELPYYIPLLLDLSDINFPNNYSVMYYASVFSGSTKLSINLFIYESGPNDEKIEMFCLCKFRYLTYMWQMFGYGLSLKRPLYIPK